MSILRVRNLMDFLRDKRNTGKITCDSSIIGSGEKYFNGRVSVVHQDGSHFYFENASGFDYLNVLVVLTEHCGYCYFYKGDITCRYDNDPAGCLEIQEYIFLELLEEWNQRTRLISSATQIASDPAFLKIIAMGRVMLPFIIRDMSKNPFLCIAAQSLVYNPPNIEKIKGQFEEITKAWQILVRDNLTETEYALTGLDKAQILVLLRFDKVETYISFPR